jgi:hypothetical protein
MNYYSHPMLSKNFKLITTFWWKGHLKVFHKRMPMYTLNFQCKQTPAQADESTIPIIFTKITLYISPNFRNNFAFTRKYRLQQREFKRLVNGVTNFTSMCETSSSLFKFLDYYNKCAIEACNLFLNLQNIVHKYQAIFKSEK